jgi:hypothetical protein
MAVFKKVRVTRRVGDPTKGVIIQPGAVVDLPAFWADRYIANGSAVEVEKTEHPKTEKPKGKKKK